MTPSIAETNLIDLLKAAFRGPRYAFVSEGSREEDRAVSRNATCGGARQTLDSQH